MKLKGSHIRNIELEIHSDKRGKLLSIEQIANGLPFSAIRSFYLFDVPFQSIRAGHAVNCHQFILALRGSVNVEHKSADEKSEIWTLSKVNEGLYVPELHYITLKDFSSDALIVIYASKAYSDTTYYSFEDLNKQ
ncbi:sugar 3,4-ketoisomerase [Fulvivirga lutea]|uniref:FdtA/QdtA family cupin domain-containing protein n=1 Tax=Fulvivirga lutea TaxID=2810512 RepID=A0A974WHF1_9BACT|nr:FdtA/QdtA family cupin domain-containing protein [Fulvivirga lutea]QSE97187.1 FdtA/QdtA family cupin domain-containing protein [Fulvivirga lutea]